MGRSARSVILAGALAGAAACAPPLAVGPGPLPAAWREVRRGAESVAFHHGGGGTIAVDTTCEDADDVPLDVSTNHLLIGIEERREHGRARLTVDGRRALRTRVDGVLDGVRVAMDLVVVKKDGCTWDLVLVAAPEVFERRRPEFDRFLAAFALVRR